MSVTHLAIANAVASALEFIRSPSKSGQTKSKRACSCKQRTWILFVCVRQKCSLCWHGVSHEQFTLCNQSSCQARVRTQS